MQGTYCYVGPLELAAICPPGQRLQLTVFHPACPGAAPPVAFMTWEAQVEVITTDRLVLLITQPGPAVPDLLTIGKVVTLFIGQTHGSYGFKAKITDCDPARRRLILAPPRLVAQEERRGQQRIPLVIPTTYRLVRFRERNLEKLAAKIGIGATDNLSQDGIALVTELLLPVGLTLALQFEFQTQPFSALGTVRRATLINCKQRLYATGIKLEAAGLQFPPSLLETIRHNSSLLSKRILV